jgi:hypothetical protein
MIAKAVRIYVFFIFVVEILLLATSMTIHVDVWLGKSQLYNKAALPVLVGVLFANFLVLCLAKERNVWKNEFSACPIWLRRVAIALGCYGFGVAITQTILRSSSGGPDDPLTISAVPLAFEAMSITVLYSVLWRGSLGATELLKRAAISFAFLGAALALLFANRIK